MSFVSADDTNFHFTVLELSNNWSSKSWKTWQRPFSKSMTVMTMLRLALKT